MPGMMGMPPQGFAPPGFPGMAPPPGFVALVSSAQLARVTDLIFCDVFGSLDSKVDKNPFVALSLEE